MTSLATCFAKDESGATAIEYGLIASIVSIAVVGALILIATPLEGLYVKVREAVALAAM